VEDFLDVRYAKTGDGVYIAYRSLEQKCAGSTVSIGARVAARAGRSEVLVSQTVRDLVAGSGFTFSDAGEHELKGVPDRWRLYRVVD
jgi:class 3 adenylate cyclase